ncbi:hypothetical protein SNE510_07300 [Streptomyces sp. NE5-10]|nr:hypothetical protein SNE510_07300 [Streptomyces sp. NE5-10]
MKGGAGRRPCGTGHGVPGHVGTRSAPGAAGEARRPVRKGGRYGGGDGNGVSRGDSRYR